MKQNNVTDAPSIRVLLWIYRCKDLILLLFLNLQTSQGRLDNVSTTLLALLILLNLHKL